MAVTQKSLLLLATLWLCSLAPASAQELEFHSYGQSDLYATSTATRVSFTHELVPISAVILNDSLWLEDEILSRFRILGQVIAPCGISIGELRIATFQGAPEWNAIYVTPDPALHWPPPPYLPNDIALASHLADIPRPVFFYVRHILTGPGVATSHPVADGFQFPLSDTVIMGHFSNHSEGNRWMYGELIEGLEAHELTHLLTDGQHIDAPANILGDPLYGRMALRLTPEQCERARASHLVRPVLF